MEEQKEKPKEASTRTNQPLPIVNLQRVYTNSFAIGITTSDVFVTLMINGRPSHQVFLSIQTSKALVKGLQKAINDFEEAAKKNEN